MQEEKPTRTTHHIVTSTLKHAGRTIRNNELIIRRAGYLDVSVWVRSQLPARPLQVLNELLPLDLQARIREPRVDPHCETFEPVPHLNGKTGDVIGTVSSEVITRVSRKKLRRFLTEGRGLDIRVCPLPYCLLG